MNNYHFSRYAPKSSIDIGVFLCKCGGNISDTVDIERLKSSIDAKVVKEFENLCSIKCQKNIRDIILEEELDRVVIAACSPITHEKTFRNHVAPLNPYLLEMANIREQCSWVHSDVGKATDKAISLTNAAIERVKYARPLDAIVRKTKRTAAVIGGGISGITTALSLANQGIKVHIIEEKPTVGGNMIKIGKVFSPEKLAEECALCLFNPLINEAVQHENINIITNAELKSSERKAGNFNLLIERKASYVEEDKCTACGNCAEVCPVEVPNEWNERLMMRKAIYKPFPQSVPDVYTIDDENCIKCGKCVKVCKMDAINLKMKGEKIPLNVGSVIIATGHKAFDLNKRPEYGYGRYDDVISQMELARIMGVNGPTNGKLLKPSDGKIPKRVVMVQCAGSRDEKPEGKRYCSKVCCMVALKHASFIRRYYPDTEIIICYTDMRTVGMYENYFRYVQSKGIKLIRGRPGDIAKKGENIVVRVEDTLRGEQVEIETDMVVLSEAMEPSEGTLKVADTLNVGLTEDLFVKEKHSKIKPVATDIEGIYVCGTAQGPKDITDSVSQANAASSKVSELINGGLEIEPTIAEIDHSKCEMCGDCVSACKYKAIYMHDERISVDPIACTGCGICISKCKNEAVEVMGQTDAQIYAMISGMLDDKTDDERRILAFVDYIGYVAADNIGINRISYPDSVRIIRVPSITRLMPKHIIYAFENGADGIFLAEYPDDIMYPAIEEKVHEIRSELLKNSIDPDRLMYYKVYAPYFRGLANKLTEFDRQVSKALDKLEAVLYKASSKDL
ncbi:ferredoxin:CoB-CoM heterodisulfide reductase subunit HdrA [Methanobacterium sp. ACI-7]|uniref:ferredoxin:CoB-CoM heterodisulfide reductase subunit HdrA n=1 Tax=unclassified Methanobacterium TaxID=2627676 RepID=UPI0039C241C3